MESYKSRNIDSTMRKRLMLTSSTKVVRQTMLVGDNQIERHVEVGRQLLRGAAERRLEDLPPTEEVQPPRVQRMFLMGDPNSNT